MARKRKKSKGRKKRGKDQKGDTPAPAAVESPGDEAADSGEDETTDSKDEEVADSQEDGADGDAAAGAERPVGEEDAAPSDEGASDDPDEDEEPVDEEPDEEDASPGGEAASGEPPVAAVIEIEDDLDDPESRAALIARAAGLDDVARSEGSSEADGDEEPDDVPESGASDQAEVASDTAEDDTEEDGTRKGTAGEDATGGEVPDGDEEEPPLIGPAALVALSEFRDEGVATIPEELVLDLGDTTGPEERDRLLAAALAHAEMQEAIYRVPTESGTTRRWKGLIAASLFLLALLVALIPPRLLVPEGPPPLTRTEEVRSLRAALLLQAEQIEAFLVREDRLPRSLGEVETALPGVRFIRSSGRLYQLLTYTQAGDPVIYDSAAPDEEFQDVGGVFTPEESS